MASDKLIVLVTGANAGIGWYVVQQLSATGKHHVLLGSRDFSKAEKAIEDMKADKEAPSNPENIEPLEIDVNYDSSIQKAAQQVEQKFGRLDILMSNAGISKAAGQNAQTAQSGDGKDLREQYMQIFNTNVFGAAVCVDLFLPLLRKSTLEGGKRIAFTGSSTSSLALSGAAKPQDGLFPVNWPIYRSSKTALNMLLLSYARKLEGEGFVVSASCPGHCGTNLNGFQGAKHPREGAKNLVEAAVGEREKHHAKLVDEEGPIAW